MSTIGQYLKDTRGELRHVAWPTRQQTIIYTVMVALLSVGVSLYLGLFDYLFTTGLARGLSILPSAGTLQVTPDQVQTTPTAPTTSTTNTIPVKGIQGSFTIPGASGGLPAPKKN